MGKSSIPVFMRGKIFTELLYVIARHPSDVIVLEEGKDYEFWEEESHRKTWQNCECADDAFGIYHNLFADYAGSIHE